MFLGEKLSHDEAEDGTETRGGGSSVETEGTVAGGNDSREDLQTKYKDKDMANLNFTKEEGFYVAKVSVTGPWNLHLEMAEGKRGVTVMQKNPGAQKYAMAWKSVEEDKKNPGNVVDMDFEHLVYPKDIKISVSEMPDVAVYTVGD